MNLRDTEALLRSQLTKDQLACMAVLHWDDAGLSEEVRPVGRPARGVVRDAGIKRRDALARKFQVNKDYIQKARTLYLNDKRLFNKVAAGRIRIFGM